jgi:hypothetical protein
MNPTPTLGQEALMAFLLVLAATATPIVVWNARRAWDGELVPEKDFGVIWAGVFNNVVMGLTVLLVGDYLLMAWMFWLDLMAWVLPMIHAGWGT